MKHYHIYILTVLLSLPFSEQFNSFPKTRWSSLHIIPDADLLDGGKFVIDINGSVYSLYNSGYKVKPAAIVNLGIAEWINLETGYAGGGTFGIKARILGETKKFLPSLAVGVHNVFSHKDAYRFGHAEDSIGSEIYLSMAKSIDNLKLRLHVGIQSIPQNDNEKVNPFFAAEKYFGRGLYLSIEMQQRNKQFVGSLITSYRPFKKRRMEVSVGIMDFGGLFVKNGDEKTVKFTRSGLGTFSRPSIFAGVRFQGALKMGRSDGFTGLEDRVLKQNESITLLQSEVDSLKKLLNKSKNQIDDMDKSIKQFSDSSENSFNQLKIRVLQKLIAIKSYYEAEPFEPENVKKTTQEIISQRDAVIPVLNNIALDKKENSQIRTYAASMMGEIKSRSAADALIEILSIANLPEIKIEALIGLGKANEIRAKYLMQQFANDPHDGVAFTASEVLKKLEKETGIKLTPEEAGLIDEKYIPEKKIGNEKKVQNIVPVSIDTSDSIVNDLQEALNPVDSHTVVESSISADSKVLDSIAAPTLVPDTTSKSSADTTIVKIEKPVVDTVKTDKPVRENSENIKKKRRKKDEKGEW